MPKIQMLKYDTKNKKFIGDNIVTNSFHDVHSFDEFDINIIDLDEDGLWENDGDNIYSINSINDINSLAAVIKNSNKTKIIFLFPQNRKFYYNYDDYDSYDYLFGLDLKDMINKTKDILSVMCDSLINIEVIYENTSTKISGKEFSSSFYFKNISYETLTESIAGKSTTMAICEDTIISSLKIEDYNQLMKFLQKIGLTEEKVPIWLEDIDMFDDKKQHEIIRDKNNIIENSKKEISNAKDIINKNNKYKSILYTNGDELVDVIFEILTLILGCDLSEFEDKKKEDFLFEIDEFVFIGEIKGVKHNVKNENVSQLDVHYQSYIDDHEDIDIDHIKAILIMNHQKNKPLYDREPVHENQIKLAVRNGGLIIETIVLLKIFEKYINKDLTKQQCIDLFKNETGLLIME